MSELSFEGTPLTVDDLVDLHEQGVEKIELIDGRIFGDEKSVLAVMKLTLKNLGMNHLIRLLRVGLTPSDLRKFSRTLISSEIQSEN